MASARVSIGKISLTVRYAALAAAEAKNSTTAQHAVSVVAFNDPALNSHAVTSSSTPEVMYVVEISGLRPGSDRSKHPPPGQR